MSKFIDIQSNSSYSDYVCQLARHLPFGQRNADRIFERILFCEIKSSAPWASTRKKVPSGFRLIRNIVLTTILIIDSLCSSAKSVAQRV